MTKEGKKLFKMLHDNGYEFISHKKHIKVKHTSGKILIITQNIRNANMSFKIIQKQVQYYNEGIK